MTANQLHKNQSSKNFEYAQIHTVEQKIQITCIRCGDFVPFKISSFSPGNSTMFIEPCLCVNQIEEEEDRDGSL